MERTGNSIGAEGRRQHGENDPQHGDKPHRQERLADQEIQEAEVDARAGQAGGDGAQGREGGGEEASESLETSPQADGVPYGEDDVQAPEGVKPTTRSRIEGADVDPERERDEG